jgi:transcriptional regulator with XRE-family HTH domain
MFALYADTMSTTLGEFLRVQRDAMDLSLREFAKRLGNVSPAHISDIENGRRYPSDELLEKMSAVLSVSVKELQTHDPRPPVETLRRLIRGNPTYGVALRKLAETKVDPDELISFLNKKANKS